MNRINVAGTGHRPNKLGTPSYSGYSQKIEDTLIRAISFHLDQRLADNQIAQIWSGMALGMDTALALYAISHGVPLVCKVPFEGQEKMWPAESQRRYRKILAQAHQVDIVCEGGYAPAKMQLRNIELCKADLLLALHDGTPGGTANCLKAAQKMGTPVENIWDTFQSLRQRL